MQRDMELIRKILLVIEQSDSGWAPQLQIEGYSEAQIGYHAYLLIDAGLAHGQDASTLRSDAPQGLITSLTWEGHEFAEAARDSGRWSRAMGIVAEKGGDVTLDVLKQLLVSLMKASFGLP